MLGLLVAVSFIGYDYREEPVGLSNMSPNNYLGVGGVYISHYLVKMFLGYFSLFVPALLVLWGWWTFAGRRYAPLMRFSLFLLVMAILLSTSSAMLSDRAWVVPGLVGGVFARFLTTFLGVFGSWTFLVVAMVLVITGYFDISVYRFTQWVVSPLKRTREYAAGLVVRRKSTAAKRKLEKEKEKKHKKESRASKKTLLEGEKIRIVLEEDKVESAVKPSTVEHKIQPSAVRKPASATTGGLKINKDAEEVMEQPEFSVAEEIKESEVDFDSAQAKAKRKEYKFPRAELLDVPLANGEEVVSREEMAQKAQLLEDTLDDFGVQAKVTEVFPGPIITRYELQPAAGVKISRIVSLADDIALALKAMRVRILAPVPGKSAVGVEIPNEHSNIVYIRTIINSEKFVNSDSVLTIALGKSSSGEIMCLDLKTMPHLLIAGSTGSGKSVCINTIITSILFKAKPEDVKFILVDPKKLELSIYKKLKGYHLMPLRDVKDAVVTSAPDAVLALRSAEVEMERRYNILAEAAVRSLDEYNRKVDESGDPGEMERLPYLVIIIDELADLMITAAKDVEEPIARLTQMARAVGIHLVVATQRPSVDVLTGVIKANFPARIAFQVATKVDSRTILDVNGAEKLLGKGDMLYMPPAQPETLRAHNSFVTLPEIDRILNHINEQPKYTAESLPSMKEEPLPTSEGDGYLRIYGRDSLFPEALRLVVTHQQGSVSLLQRRLKVGYSRAARLIDDLEQAGVVGPFEGSKARDVLWNEDDLRKNLEGDDEEDE